MVKSPLPSDLYWALRDFLQCWEYPATGTTVRRRDLCFSLCLEHLVWQHSLWHWNLSDQDGRLYPWWLHFSSFSFSQANRFWQLGNSWPESLCLFFSLEALQTVLMNQKLDRAGTAGKLLSAQHSPRHSHRVATSHRHYMERKGWAHQLLTGQLETARLLAPSFVLLNTSGKYDKRAWWAAINYTLRDGSGGTAINNAGERTVFHFVDRLISQLKNYTPHK